MRTGYVDATTHKLSPHIKHESTKKIMEYIIPR